MLGRVEGFTDSVETSAAPFCPESSRPEEPSAPEEFPPSGSPPPSFSVVNSEVFSGEELSEAAGAWQAEKNILAKTSNGFCDDA